MHRNLKFAFAAAVSAAFLMAAATVEATSITQNGGIIVSDTYEGDAVGADVVAEGRAREQPLDQSERGVRG